MRIVAVPRSARSSGVVAREDIQASISARSKAKKRRFYLACARCLRSAEVLAKEIDSTLPRQFGALRLEDGGVGRAHEGVLGVVDVEVHLSATFAHLALNLFGHLWVRPVVDLRVVPADWRLDVGELVGWKSRETVERHRRGQRR